MILLSTDATDVSSRRGLALPTAVGEWEKNKIVTNEDVKKSFALQRGLGEEAANSAGRGKEGDAGGGGARTRKRTAGRDTIGQGKRQGQGKGQRRGRGRRRATAKTMKTSSAHSSTGGEQQRG